MMNPRLEIGALLAATIPFTACGGADPTVTAEIASYGPGGLVIAANTSPGCSVSVRGAEVEADESGRARIEVSLDDLYGNDVTIDSTCPSLFSDEWAFSRLDLPFPPEVAKTLPSDPSADWVRVVGVGDSGEIGISVKGASSAELFRRISGKVPLEIELMGKPRIAVSIGGVASTLDSDGKGRVEVPVRALVGKLTASALEDYGHTIELPVTVGEGVAQEPLVVHVEGIRRLIANHLAGVAKGHAPVADAPDAVRAAAVVMADGEDLAMSAEASVDEIDVVAVMKESGRRSAEPCVYEVVGGAGTFSTTPTLVDMSATVVDLRSGKALGERDFAGSLAECPMFVNEGESITRSVDADAVLPWAEELAGDGGGAAAAPAAGR